MPEGADLTSYVISLDNAVRAVTSAIDLVGIDEIHHGKRVAVMAQALADAMDWPTERTVKLFRAALLHDCGVSKSEEHRELVSQMEWESRQIAELSRTPDGLEGVRAFVEKRRPDFMG